MRRPSAAAPDDQLLADLREQLEATVRQCDLVLAALARLRTDLADSPLLAERLPPDATAAPPSEDRERPELVGVR